jgi:hypothetical protein
MANIKYKYTKEILEAAVKKSKSYSDVLRHLGIKLAGGNHAHIKRQIKKFGIDTSHFGASLEHFLAAAAKKAINSRLSPDEVFNSSREYRLKGKILTRALLSTGREYRCVECGVAGTYNGKPITLEVDHIDENWKNNKQNNLQFICPNCHSQKS